MQTDPNSARLLLIRAADCVTDEEISAVKTLAAIHDVKVVEVDRSKGEKIPSSESSGCFTLVYLASHGDVNFLQSGADSVKWDEFANDLCASTCILPGSTLFCSCCHGGMRTVARSVFKICPNIEFVCGPKSTVTTHTLTLAFHAFMYNIFFRRGGADQVTEMLNLVTGHTFLVHEHQAELEQHNMEKGSGNGAR